MSSSFQDSSLLVVTFDGMAHGGDAVAHDDTGRAIFVPYATPGETARIRILSHHKGFARGQLVEILQPSPERVPPRCPHFPKVPREDSEEVERLDETRGIGCGGCQWQHMSYQAQLNAKYQIVRDAFRRIGKLSEVPIEPTIPAVSEWNYRNQMQFALAPDGTVCLRAPRSHLLVPIRECHILADQLVSLFNSLDLRDSELEGVTLRAGVNTGDAMVILESTKGEVPEIETDEVASIVYRGPSGVYPLIGNPHITERIGEWDFQISPDSFFQVNTPMAAVLVELVARMLQPQTTDTLLDAYGGVGLFGVSLANQVANVILVEENETAVNDARQNARTLSNFQAFAGRVEQVLPSLSDRIDIIVADPPRTGLGRQVIDALVDKQPRVIAYVSCDPPTLARDARLFSERGYRAVSVQPIDMFPQTFHIECVANFVR